MIRSTQTSSGLMLNTLWPASPMRLTLSSPVVILIGLATHLRYGSARGSLC